MADITSLAEKKQTWGDFELSIASEISSNRGMYAFIDNPELLARNCVEFLKNSKQLMEFCGKYGTAKFKAAVLESARMGLDATKHEVYLVPNGSNLDAVTSYIGMRNLTRRHSVRPVIDVYAEVVREGDEFSYSFENGKYTYKFTPKPFNTAPFVGAFAVVEFVDGGNRVEAIDETELKTIKSKTRGRGAVWNDFPGEMRKKAVIRRLAKGIQIDFDNVTGLQAYIDNDMKIESNVDAGDVTDVYADSEVVES